MKKLALLFGAAILILVACSKDDEEKTFAKADLLGKWQQTNPASEDPGCDSYSVFMEFSETEIISTSTCDGDESLPFSIDYEFDGKKVTYDFIFTITLTIIELTDDKLVCDEEIEGLVDPVRITYTRVD